jgi:hypothetical protein
MPENADEGEKGVEGATPPEGDKGGKSHPESVPYHQYIGLKEKFTRVETELRGQVSSLEEQLKKAVSAEEVTKLTEQLTKAKEAQVKAESDLAALKNASLSEKRAYLIKKGIPEKEANEMSEKELTNVQKVLDNFKPKPDMGTGGGSGVPLKGSPMDLARLAYSQSNKSK